MNVAVLSVAALALAIAVNCVSRLNVGILAIALAWVVGVYFGKMPLATVVGGFPTTLFVTLVGVTLLFTIAQLNGTLDKLTHHAVRMCRGNRGLIPIMFFVLGAGLGSIGPGNIATAALLSPMAMATAARVGIPLILMAIMVGNGANAGALSPFAPTGIISSGLMNRIGMPGLERSTFLYNLLAHALLAFGGYFLLGGWKLFRSSPTQAAVASTAPAGAGGVIERRHWITLGVIVALIVSVIGLRVDVGMGAFAGSIILVALGCGDDLDAIKKMPWGVILMVTGVTVLIGVLEKAQGIDLIVRRLASVATVHTITGEFAFVAGLISVYSSTSGVILPTFLPMIPSLVKQIPGANAFALSIAVNVGGHLVDVSPVSTIGALAIASSPTTGEETRVLFNKLLAWGLSMSIIGAILCALLFPA